MTVPASLMITMPVHPQTCSGVHPAAGILLAHRSDQALGLAYPCRPCVTCLVGNSAGTVGVAPACSVSPTVCCATLPCTFPCTFPWPQYCTCAALCSQVPEPFPRRPSQVRYAVTLKCLLRLSLTQAFSTSCLLLVLQPQQVLETLPQTATLPGPS
jgi:hypothetical protein